MEEIEKTRLLKAIKGFDGDKTRKYLYGINEKAENFKNDFKKKQKQFRLLSKIQQEKKVFTKFKI